MAQFKGTPGPWRVSEKRGNLIDIRHENNEPGTMSLNLAQIVARQSWLKEAEANARLIAAAPELLEALQMALEWIDAVPSDTLLPAMPGFDRDEVNSIINKATGETK